MIFQMKTFYKALKNVDINNNEKQVLKYIHSIMYNLTKFSKEL